MTAAKGESGINREWVSWNLKEAIEELEKTINELKNDEPYDDPELSVRLTEVYHHLNTAWNSRKASPAEVRECSQDNFDKWRQMPADIFL